MLLSRVGRTQLPLPRGIKFIDAIALQAATRVDCHDSSPAGLTAMKDLSTCRVVCASCDRLPALTNRHVLHRDLSIAGPVALKRFHLGCVSQRAQTGRRS